MKKKNKKQFADIKKAFALFLCMNFVGCGSQNTESTEAKQNVKENTKENTKENAKESAKGNETEQSAKALKALLEKDDFYVQDGQFNEFNTIELASQGKLMSCFGNNAGSIYTVFNLPAAPDQDNAKGNPERGWADETATIYDNPDIENYPANPFFSPAGWQYKLRSDEALVLITQLPPECKYYSFINYVMFTEEKPGKDYSGEKGYFQVGNKQVGFYHPTFGSIGSSINFRNIKTDGQSGFGTKAVIIISANQSVTEKVKNQLNNAGYSDEMINIMTIPEKTYKMGLEKGADTFCFIGRISQPSDEDAYEGYISHITENSTVFRVTPKTEIASAPYANETLIPRGTGIHEVAKLDDAEKHLEEIRNALIAQYSDEYDYEELSSDIAVPEGLTAYLRDTNSQGDNRDTSYLMTKDFTLNSDEDFVVVYGVNHTATGKACYSNAVLYARPMLNGVCSVYDSLFGGSADQYLETDCEDADDYYVYKMARTKMDDYTKIIEYSTGNEKGKYYGVDNGETLLLAFRAYVDETGVGPSYYEIVYDRAIVFHKK